MNFVQSESLFSKRDVVAQGAVSCRFGVFIGDLLLCSLSGSLRILQLKQHIVPHAIHIHDPEAAKDAERAHTCEGWFEFALQEGYHMSIEECFPQRFWDHDFDTVDYQDQLNILRQRMDLLDTVNMLDAEFVASLQSGGAAFAEIAAQVAAEASVRSVADSALDSRVLVCEQKTSYLDPTTQTLLSAESTSRIAGDDALDLRLDACEAKTSYLDPTTQTLLSAESTSRIAGDDALDLRLDACEAKSSYLDPTTQTLLSAESVSRAAADSALDVRVSACESTDVAHAGRLTTLEATSSVIDPITASQVAIDIAAAKTQILGAPSAALDTLQELGTALSDDASFSSTVTGLISQKAPQSTTYTKAEVDSAVAAVQADVNQNETDADAAIALRALQSTTYTKAEVDSAVAAVQADVNQNETDADAAIALKAPQSTTYTKAEVDSAVAAVQADVDSNETDADAAIALRALQSTTYTKSEVDTAVGLRVLTTDYTTKQNSQDALDVAATSDRALIRAEFAAQDALRATKAAPSFTGIAVFTNNVSDADQMRVYGADGDIRFQGGCNLNFNRSGGTSKIRNTATGGGLEFQVNASGNKAMEIASTKKVTMESHLLVKGSEIDFTGLPTSDPGVTGRLWNDGNTLKISA